MFKDTLTSWHWLFDASSSRSHYVELRGSHVRYHVWSIMSTSSAINYGAYAWMSPGDRYLWPLDPGYTCHGETTNRIELSAIFRSKVELQTYMGRSYRQMDSNARQCPIMRMGHSALSFHPLFVWGLDFFTGVLQSLMFTVEWTRIAICWYVHDSRCCSPFI